jgi:endoglucanase
MIGVFLMQGTEHTAFYLHVLQELVSQPTAPFREERVAAKVGSFLHEWGVPFSLDEFGNIIAHYQRGAACRPLVLMAHMDHPAFTVTEQGGLHSADFTARLEGGVNTKCFEQPVAVKLYVRACPDQSLAGHVVGFSQTDKPRSVQLYLKMDNPAELALVGTGDFGIWDLPDFELSDGFIHARVIDDLVGCASTLLTLWKLVQEQAETDVYGVFTRAEEVGLIGAEAVVRSGILPRDAYIVSLEASKTLPGALQGEGPVVRVGDKLHTFSEEAEFVLRAAVLSLNKDSVDQAVPRFKTQRQLMSGGGCEAGAALLGGYLATGLAYPLGNYHNVTADFRLEPENIAVADYEIGVLLLQEAARLMPKLAELQATQLATLGNIDNYLERLRQSQPTIQRATTQ